MSSKLENQIREMFILQNQLNINTNGKDWINGFTKEGRKINWFRCIYMETAEAIDSLNWKHWKDIDKPDDIENLKIELVDIIHFIISQFIKESAGNINNLIELLTKLIKEHTSTLPIIDYLEMLLSEAVKMNIQQVAYFYIQIINHPDYKNVWNFQEIYALYIGKNCLNQFRQDNGYKDGTYKKMWNGNEDNVYMQKYIKNYPDFNYKSLYDYLTFEYKKGTE